MKMESDTFDDRTDTLGNIWITSEEWKMDSCQDRSYLCNHNSVLALTTAIGLWNNKTVLVVVHSDQIK
jgi:hypothetical protein